MMCTNEWCTRLARDEKPKKEDFLFKTPVGRAEGREVTNELAEDDTHVDRHAPDGAARSPPAGERRGRARPGKNTLSRDRLRRAMR